LGAIVWAASRRRRGVREKSLKNYKREWKVNLIERGNRHWDDLAAELLGEGPSPFPPLPLGGRPR
jgi:predicted GIY-YIG superfamily endonuclease